jgi:hypothetical protein
MLQVIAAVLALLLSPGEAPAQSAPDRPAAGVNRETGSPGSAGPKDEGVVQRGSQPNAGEVRPGNRDGDSPSASAGELRRQEGRRIFGLPIASLEREGTAAGVMMLPVPRAGTLRAVEGVEDAARVPGIEDVAITVHAGQRLEPLPEGWQYLGFIFARGARPEDVEHALRDATARLKVSID